jgi:hypothetical protein
MIISNLIGGLGNQMFQYACGRSLSLSTNQPFCVATDQFESYVSHNGFELGRVFNIDVPVATKIELKQLIGWRASPFLRHLLGRPSMRWLRSKGWVIEPHFHFWPGLSLKRGANYLHGYWQSERYFEQHSELIRSEFKFNLPFCPEDLNVIQRMRLQPSASLHVRRGDYLNSKNNSIFSLCGINYYRAAINHLRGSVPNIKFFAFSDDPAWVEENLNNDLGSIEVVRHNLGTRSAHDMRLMSHADHHIIANSSFSWWGAWLNPSVSKIVIAPRIWFTNGINDRDLIPASWVRL